MTDAYLGLGGNVGEPRRAMVRALQALDANEAVSVAAVSPLYRTPPWGKADQPDYLNAVARIETTLSARPLLDLCLATERRLDRVRSERWGPRPIDIDLLLFGEEAIDEEGLRVPHPHMAERAFVMIPLADIAPSVMVAGLRAASHARALPGEGIVRITDDGEWWRE